MHRYTTQFYSSTNRNINILNETQLSDDFGNNPKSYFHHNKNESFDIAIVTNFFMKSHSNKNNKNDFLSINSSISSKEEEVDLHINYKAEAENTKNLKDLKYIEIKSSMKILESDSSSFSSLDSFELEFEDVIKYFYIRAN